MNNINISIKTNNVLNIDNKLYLKKIKNHYIFYTNFKKINAVKNNIENYLDLWDKNKKYTNPYEKVSNSFKSPTKPISRSFFKLLEIIHNFNLINKKENKYIFSNNAEGPGGFIEALHYYRKNKNDIFFGTTLYPKNYNIPNWSRLKKNVNTPNLHLSYNDIYQIKHINYILSNFNKEKADFVTCDGGFDYSSDFNRQEEMSYRIIFSEILLILGINKIGGSCIIKIFDIFTIFTIKCIYLLSTFYKEINLYKPLTSRIANSEKYIVCKGFIGCSDEILEQFKIIVKDLNNHGNKNIDLIGISVSNEFITLLEKANSEFVEQQIHCINDTIDIIKNPKKLDKFKISKNQDKLAKEWYEKYL